MRKYISLAINYLKYIMLVCGGVGAVYTIKRLYTGISSNDYMVTEMVVITAIVEIMSFVTLYKSLKVDPKEAKRKVAILMNGVVTLLELFYVLTNMFFHFHASNYMLPGVLLILGATKMVLITALFTSYHQDIGHKNRLYFLYALLGICAIELLNAVNVLDVLTTFNYILALSLPVGEFIFYIVLTGVLFLETNKNTNK